MPTFNPHLTKYDADHILIGGIGVDMKQSLHDSLITTFQKQATKKMSAIDDYFKILSEFRIPDMSNNFLFLTKN
jgi:hypothetical protein